MLEMLKSRTILALAFFLLAATVPSLADSSADRETAPEGPRLRVPALFYSPPLDAKPLLGREPGPAPPPADEPRAFSLMAQSRSSLFDRIYGPDVVVLSRSESALKGAGLGMKAGWVAACLARQTGMWNDRTSWYMAGAAAAAGAILGGTAWADNPSWNIRVEWDDDEPPR
jgi:hypothetical protein